MAETAGARSCRRRGRMLALALTLALALSTVVVVPAAASDGAFPDHRGSSQLATLLGIAAGATPLSDHGTVRVILHLEVDGPVAPTGGPVDPASARASAAEATAKATEKVTAALASRSLHVEVARTFTRVPYMAVSVDLGDLPALSKLPGVVAVTPDQVVEPMLDTSVPQIGASEPTPSYAGADVDGSGYAIAVIDTGVQADHPFIGADRVVAEACYSSSADCPNETNEQTGTGAGAPINGHDHGTHVAGIALGAKGTAGPTQGVAPGADVIAVQAFSVTSTDDGGEPLSYGAYTSDLTKSLEFVLDQHVASNQIEVAAVNLSLGTAASASCPTTGWTHFLDEVSHLRAAGIVTIAASGNDRDREAISLPACFPGVVSVGATTALGEIAWFSNVSDDTDLVAPGSGINSSVPTDGFATKSGTSMAAPHAAGVAALLRAAAPWTGADDVETALRTSLTLVDDTRTAGDGFPAGSVTDLPYLDVRSASTALPGVAGGPGAATELTASPGDGEVALAWSAPDSSGSSAIERYDVLARPGGATCSVTGSPTPTSCVVEGLSNGTAYTFTVLASNGNGPGPSSAPLEAVVPAVAPDPPTNVQASAGVSEATVSWEPPAEDGGSPVIGYEVTSDPGGLTCSTEDASGTPPDPATSCVVGGLTGDETYTFRVTASNAAATSEPSSPSDPVTPESVPSAPTNVSATAGDGAATVEWDAPDSSGTSDIIRYRATSSPGGHQCTSENGTNPPTTCEVESLTNGTEYTFTVTATNEAGTGPSSSPSDPVTPTGKPGAPTELVAEPGDGEVALSWTEPASDGGLAITRYLVAVNGSDDRDCGTATSCVIDGLTNGADYTFTVRAENPNGVGPTSDPTPTTTPATVPASPTDVQVAAGDPETAVVSWTAPTDDGGSTITSSTVTSDPHGRTCTADGELTTCTVTGLTGGQEYTFTVVATNARGDSEASAASEPFTPEASSGGGGGGGGLPPPEDDPDDSHDGEPEPALDDDGALPSLSPGTSELLVDGTSTTISVTSTSTSLTFSAGSLTVALHPTSSTGASLGTVEDSTLSVTTGGGLRIDVDGLESGSELHGWLFSDPLLLGSLTTSSTGTLAATLEIPDDVPVGDHTVQLNGVLDDGRSVTLNLGVGVVDDVSFPDVDPDATHGEAILRLARLGIVTGFEDGTYRPSEVVTRGQMATFLQRALGLDPGDPGAFPDIEGTAHELAIGAIAEADIAGGFPDGTYRPGAAVIRGQMATFLANGAGLAEVADGPFSDVDGTTHAGRINAVAAAGIAAGFDDGTFRPGRDVTRAQMASFISRLLDHLDAAA